MKYHKTLGLTLLAGTLLALGMPASAEKSAGACEADTAKFCKDVKPGGGRIADCLKEHEKELSQACSEHRKQAAEKRAKHSGKRGERGFGRAWNGEKGGGDSDRRGFKGAWSKGDKGGGTCMSQYGEGFAQGFQRGFKMRANIGGAKGGKGGKKGAHKGSLTRVCAADTEKLCGEIKPGGGRLRDCLLNNIGKLSDGCKARAEKVKERLEKKSAEKGKEI